MDQHDVMASGVLLHYPCVQQAPDVKLTNQRIFQGCQLRPMVVQFVVARKHIVDVEFVSPSPEGFDL
jgi:hypothetical protein